MQAEDPDVVLEVDGFLRPSVVVSVSLTDEEATARAVNGPARRAEEVVEFVKAGRAVVSGTTVGFDFEKAQEPREVG